MLDVKYYQIDENAARIAHEMNSFRDYDSDQTTREYQKQVDEAAKIAEAHKANVEPVYHEKIDGLLDTYSRKLAAWYNKNSAIECMCPSMMICGGGNFPVRKKEKQNAARDKHMKEWDKIQGLIEKIRTVGTKAKRHTSGRVEGDPNQFQGWAFDGGNVVANTEANRLQLFFEGKPGDELRGLLKHKGFRWAPSVGAWQRQLTCNAVFAARAILQEEAKL